jgi:hypothetical protein
MANDGTEPEYLAAVARILSAAKVADLPVLTFAPTAEMIEVRRRQGYRMFMAGADGFALTYGMRKTLAEGAEAIKKVEAELGIGK